MSKIKALQSLKNQSKLNKVDDPLLSTLQVQKVIPKSNHQGGRYLRPISGKKIIKEKIVAKNVIEDKRQYEPDLSSFQDSIKKLSDIFENLNYPKESVKSIINYIYEIEDKFKIG